VCEILRARETGVAFSTLDDDCRIYEAFGDEILLEKETTREVYFYPAARVRARRLRRDETMRGFRAAAKTQLCWRHKPCSFPAVKFLSHVRVTCAHPTKLETV
jgi:hypothetical protein